MLQRLGGEPESGGTTRQHLNERVGRRLTEQGLKGCAVDQELRLAIEEAVGQVHTPRVEEGNDLIDGGDQGFRGCHRAPSCRMNRVSSGVSQPGIAGTSGSPGSISMNSPSVFRKPGITRTISWRRAHANTSSIDDRLDS